jgi:hypothetical protein
MELIAIFLHLLNGEVAKIPVGLALNKVTCETAFHRVIDKNEDKNEDKNTFNYKGVEIIVYYCKNNKGDWIP